MGLKTEEATKKRLREVCRRGIDLYEAAFVNSDKAYEFRKT